MKDFREFLKIYLKSSLVFFGGGLPVQLGYIALWLYTPFSAPWPAIFTPVLFSLFIEVVSFPIHFKIEKLERGGSDENIEY